MSTLRSRKLRTYNDCYSIEGDGTWLTISRERTAPTAPLRMSIEREGDLDRHGPMRAATDIDALFGVFRLLAGPYLAVVKASTRVAGAPGVGAFHRVDRVELLPVSGPPDSALSAAMRKDEAQFLKLIHSVFKTRSFYFCSGGYEATHTVQRIYDLQQDSSAPTSHWDRADERLMWNAHLLSDFTESGLAEASAWVTPMINGFVGYRPHISFGGSSADLLLISRRSRHRQGTRFNRRGIDTEGDVANFVETEQILMHDDGRVSSSVQVRGSIPVYWSQDPTMKYTPKCRLNPDFTVDQASLACRTHMQALNDRYHGSVTAVNLIDTKKDQLMLGEAYRAATEKANAAGAEVQYVWFDFHKECRKMRYDRLSILMGEVKSQLGKTGIFQTSTSGSTTRTQRGVLRTNCMDNLDRTNVVQSLFGRWAVLEALGTSPTAPAQSTDVLDSKLPEFEKAFKNVWADNADAMSFLYSGTGALKTDFTRTGKRTIAGALQDGVNSVTRYFLNNFADGRRQDAWDLFTGRYTPLGATAYTPASSPLRKAETELTPTGLLLGVFVLNLCIIAGTAAVLSATGSSSSLFSKLTVGSILSSFAIGTMAYFSMGKGLSFGRLFVSKPHLTHKNDVSRAKPVSP